MGTKSKNDGMVCVFRSEDCGGDTRRVKVCGHHFGDFVVWMNVRKLKMAEEGRR